MPSPTVPVSVDASSLNANAIWPSPGAARPLGRDVSRLPRGFFLALKLRNLNLLIEFSFQKDLPTSEPGPQRRLPPDPGQIGHCDILTQKRRPRGRPACCKPGKGVADFGVGAPVRAGGR